jgi:uncharacterized protein (TIRG00374 family)
VTRKAAKALLLALGIGVLAYILWKVGWPAIHANLALVGWRFFLLVALNFVSQAGFTAGWALVLEPRPRSSGLPSLFAVYLAGDALNYLTPGNVAGEPLKAQLLRREFGGGNTVASLTLHKHAELMAQCLYVLVAAGAAVALFRLPEAIQLLAVAGAAALGLLLALMTWALRVGSFAAILSRLSRFAWLEKRVGRFLEPARSVDERIRTFYERHPWRFAGAILCCLVGWCGGLLETYILLTLLTGVSSFRAALAAEGLAMVLNNMLLFMPGRIGSAEGIRVAVLVLLGYPAAKGVAWGIVRRARELIWIGLGIAVLVKRHVRISPVAPATVP